MIIRKVNEEDGRIGDFINEEFSAYGEQNEVALNYEDYCFVAEDDNGDIMGVITGRAYYNEVHIGDLIVGKNYRRSGLGRKLVEAVEETYKGKLYEKITLTTFGFQAPEFYMRVIQHIVHKIASYESSSTGNDDSHLRSSLSYIQNTNLKTN